MSASSIANTVDEITFAELTEEQRTYLERVQIGDAFVTPEQIDEIADMFALAKKSRSELTAIRNSVVKYLGDLASIMRYCDNARGYDRALNALSGITSVIDHAIYCTSY